MAITPGKGTILQLSIASVYTSIAQLVAVTPPPMEMGEIETTDLSSTWRSYIAAIIEPAEVELTVNLDTDNATHAQLWTSFQAGTLEAWKVIFPAPSGTIFAFSGFLKKYAPDEMVVDGKAMAKLGIKLSGAVTLTP